LTKLVHSYSPWSMWPKYKNFKFFNFDNPCKHTGVIYASPNKIILYKFLQFDNIEKSQLTGESVKFSVNKFVN